MVHFGRVCKDYCGIQGKEGGREELKAYAQARQGSQTRATHQVAGYPNTTFLHGPFCLVRKQTEEAIFADLWLDYYSI